MIYLGLDTCVWLNIAKLDDDTLLSSFEQLLNEEKITFIVPEIVKIEFSRNKEIKVIEPLKKSYHSKLKNIQEMSKLVEQPDSELIQSIFKKYTDNYEQLLTVHRKNIERIERILTDGIHIEPSIEQKAEGAMMALDKKAPFFGEKKNEMTDCLILFSVLEAARKQNCKPIYFITDNVDDFAVSKREENNERFTMHENIAHFFDEPDVKYLLSPKITELVDMIQPDLINEDEAKRINEDFTFIREAEERRKKCNHEFDTENGFWFNSMYGGGLSWHYRCKNCGVYYDTGDYYN
ncbi:PIN domain-containing protein [Bacillus sp. MUM 13]|uniref:PIN domain-containing protein n=1 Tax=Bacillus sp. MUM 13 TaxID=1678001 RepID=UPI0008F56F4E|nr:PIN domain-containing protein [Bacillus sp. MUM 13]OIK07158.1 hypothetical protein BIV59_21240 [Bacillus sp. MUM 13]